MCLAICFISTIATAQKITESALQGKWKMTALTTQGVSLDIEKKEVTIPEEMKAQLPPETVQQIEESMKQAAEPLSESYMQVEKGNITHVMGPQQEKGTFKISDKDNKQFLTTTLEDGTSNEAEIAMVGNKLHVTQSDGVQAANFIYTKQQ
mgnify:CR=1 FL=1